MMSHSMDYVDKMVEANVSPNSLKIKHTSAFFYLVYAKNLWVHEENMQFLRAMALALSSSVGPETDVGPGDTLTPKPKQVPISCKVSLLPGKDLKGFGHTKRSV